MRKHVAIAHSLDADSSRSLWLDAVEYSKCTTSLAIGGQCLFAAMRWEENAAAAAVRLADNSVLYSVAYATVHRVLNRKRSIASLVLEHRTVKRREIQIGWKAPAIQLKLIACEIWQTYIA